MKKFIILKITTILLLGLLVINVSTAETYTSFIKIVGVDNEGRGIVGNVTVEIQPGKGRVLVDTKPIHGIYTQYSERTAVEVAGEVTGFDFSDYDVIYTIMTPKAQVVEGPSAGGAMALTTIAAIKGKTISPAFAMTGTIQKDHSIGQVGEILAKVKAAADSSVTVFLIPKGQAIQNQYVRKVQSPAPGWRIETIEPVPVNVIEYAKDNWNLTVYEVNNIEEVMTHGFGEIPAPEERKPQLPEENFSLPTFTSPVQSYNEFSGLINNEIARAEDSYEQAKDKLDSSLLTEDLKSVLGSILEDTKAYLQEAKEIEEMGYLYSGGNDAFKCIINSETVIDIIEYYSSPYVDRGLYLDNRLNEVKKEISQVKQEVMSRSVCDLERFEWSVAARERVTYAENKINSIQVSSPILINNQGTGTSLIDILYAINTAEEWIEISKNFVNKTVFGNSTCLSKFEDDAEKILTEAENEISIAKSLGIDTSDAEWYLDAAEKEFSEGWYITAIYDATSAKTRAIVGSKYEGKGVNEIYRVFNETEFETEDLFGTIYLEHSYFMIYKAVRDDSDVDALQAIQLLMLSKNFNEDYKQIKERLGTPFPWQFDLRLSTEVYILILLLIILCIGLYVIRLRSRIKKLEEK